KTGYSATLELNGRAVETKQVNLAANGAASVEFTAAPLPAGTTRGVVRLPNDALARDNTFYFAISRGQSLSVLVVDGREGAAPRRAIGPLTRPSSFPRRPIRRLTAAPTAAARSATSIAATRSSSCSARREAATSRRRASSAIEASRPLRVTSSSLVSTTDTSR